MAKVAIDTRQLDNLPDLCVKTGEPTERVRRQDFVDLPGWTLLLIFWGLIAFLIAAGFARRKVTADLPVSEEVLRRLRLVGFGAGLGIFLGIGFLVGAVVSQEAAYAWAGVAVALITLVTAAVARNLVWVRGRLDGETLWLHNVHPAFAEEARGLAPRDLPRRVEADRRATRLWIAVGIAVVLFLLVGMGIRQG